MSPPSAVTPTNKSRFEPEQVCDQLTLVPDEFVGLIAESNAIAMIKS